MPTIKDNSEMREGGGKLVTNNGVASFSETISYIVVADSKYQTRLDILQTAGLPLLGTTTGPSGFGVCKSKTATRIQGEAKYWKVTCEFSSEVEEGEGNDPESDPVTWVPVYETKFERFQEPVIKDIRNKPIVNSANYPYSQGVEITRHIPVWNFFQFEPASVTDETIMGRSEKVNQNAFKGRKAKSLLCVVVSSQIGFYFGRRVRYTNYQLKYNEETWKLKRLDWGPYYLDGGAPGGTITYFTDATDPAARLGLLDGAGDQGSITDPQYQEFDIYKSIAFNFLRF